MFNLVRVKSTSALALAHNADENKLRVFFKSGSVYEYANVDSELFVTILNGSESLTGEAHSIGAAISRYIVSNEVDHPYVKLEGMDDTYKELTTHIW